MNVYLLFHGEIHVIQNPTIRFNLVIFNQYSGSSFALKKKFLLGKSVLHTVIGWQVWFIYIHSSYDRSKTLAKLRSALNISKRRMKRYKLSILLEELRTSVGAISHAARPDRPTLAIPFSLFEMPNRWHPVSLALTLSVEPVTQTDLRKIQRGGDLQGSSRGGLYILSSGRPWRNCGNLYVWVGASEKCEQL